MKQSNRISVLTILALLFVASQPARTATLKPETVAAWNGYLQSVDAELQTRVQHGANFLSTLEDEEQAARVRAGEIVVNPAPGQNPKRVSGGLIHHWTGAMFVPNVKLDDLLEVTRDYDHYKDYYHPSVIDSKLMARHGSQDRFSMLLMNKAFFLKTALDAEYEANDVRIDGNRFYRVAKTTRVQEIKEFGHPEEQRLPDGEGGGYIWRMYSVVRFEQRDHGVYVEMEAVALSRDIPFAARLFAEPVVRRVSRDALLLSLQQTQDAVRNNTNLAKSPAQPVPEPANVSFSGFR